MLTKAQYCKATDRLATGFEADERGLEVEPRSIAGPMAAATIIYIFFIVFLYAFNCY